VWTDVGTAFAFSHKYLFTAYQVIHEPDPEFKVLEIVGSVPDLDTSVLRCHSLHFLDLDSNAQSYGSLAWYTRYKGWSLMVYYGRAYPGILPFEGRCDAPSTDGCSRGPVTERGGNAIGMFKGCWGLDGVFVKAEGSLHALAIIWTMTRKEWD